MFGFSYISTIVISLPLLLPVWHQTQISNNRSIKVPWSFFSDGYYNFTDLFLGFFFPYLKEGRNPEESKWFLNLHNLSHIGYLTIIFIFFLFIFGKKIFKENSRKGKPSNKKSLKNKLYDDNSLVDIKPYIIVSAFLGTFSLLWATKIITIIIYYIPLLNRFREPYRIIMFTDFYLIILGAIGFYLFNKYIMEKSVKVELYRNIIFGIVIACIFLNWTSLYLTYPLKTFGLMVRDKVPLQEPLKDTLTAGRIFTIGFPLLYENPEGSPIFLHNTSASLAQNYATLWGLYHFGGYTDPLMSKDNLYATLGISREGYPNFDPDYFQKAYNYFRTWGVRYYVTDKNVFLPKKYGFKKISSDEKRDVYEDVKALPFFFWENDMTNEGIYGKINTNSIELTVSSEKSRRIIVNFLFNPFFKSYIDGSYVETKANKSKQMLIDVPAGNHKLSIVYSDPYLKVGTYCAIIFIGLLFVAFFVDRSFVKTHIFKY
jgi:hypothetical protein